MLFNDLTGGDSELLAWSVLAGSGASAVISWRSSTAATTEEPVSSPGCSASCSIAAESLSSPDGIGGTAADTNGLSTIGLSGPGRLSPETMAGSTSLILIKSP